MLAKFVMTFNLRFTLPKCLLIETLNPTKTLSAVSVFQHYVNDSSSFANLEMSSSFVLKFSSHISPRTILVGLTLRCSNLI